MAEANPPSVRIDVSGTRFHLVRKISEELNMSVVEVENEECDLYWVDTAVPLEKFIHLKPHQMINHFFGMGEISRKDALAKNIRKMKEMHAVEYDILPQTWVLPHEYRAFMKDTRKRRNSKTYIIKPPNSSMGNGISLVRSISDIPQGENVIVQEYVSNPLLLDGYKFDLRVYVLVTSCNPLRVFIYKDGLVRLSTQKYQAPNDSNIHCSYMHLTNYSINKHSESFNHHEDFDKGSKRSLKYLNGWLAKNNQNTAELWSRINDLVVKTLIMAQPNLKHSYQACRPGSSLYDKCQSFEILGFDILLDQNLKPWLLEVNRSPSFGIDAHIDLQIKTGVVTDAIRLADIRPAGSDRSKRQLFTTTAATKMQRMSSQRRLFVQPLKSQQPMRPRSPLDFAGEIEDAHLINERKIGEIKCRLSHIRKQKELEQFEDQYKGEYTRIYPSSDPLKQMLYEKFIKDSATVCYQIKPESRYSVVRGLERMKERELVELLDQYESDEIYYTDPDFKSKLKPVKPLSYREQSPLEAEFQAMAAREYEEEQTQRTMLSLNALEPSYPGKKTEEVKSVIQEVLSDWADSLRPKVKNFWLNVLDSTRRKQLLCPLRDTIRRILHSHWRTAVLDSIRLHKIFIRLFNFFLNNHGQGLWCTFPGAPPTEEHWEKAFKRKTDVMSIIEMCCCRRAVELVQGTVMAAYSYYIADKQLSSKKITPPPSLLRRTSSIYRRPLTVADQCRPQISRLSQSRSKLTTSSMMTRTTSSSSPSSHVHQARSFPRIISNTNS